MRDVLALSSLDRQGVVITSCLSQVTARGSFWPTSKPQFLTPRFPSRFIISVTLISNNHLGITNPKPHGVLAYFPTRALNYEGLLSMVVEVTMEIEMKTDAEVCALIGEKNSIFASKYCNSRPNTKGHTRRALAQCDAISAQLRDSCNCGAENLREDHITADCRLSTEHMNQSDV